MSSKQTGFITSDQTSVTRIQKRDYLFFERRVQTPFVSKLASANYF